MSLWLSDYSHEIPALFNQMFANSFFACSPTSSLSVLSDASERDYALLIQIDGTVYLLLIRLTGIVKLTRSALKHASMCMMLWRGNLISISMIESTFLSALRIASSLSWVFTLLFEITLSQYSANFNQLWMMKLANSRIPNYIFKPKHNNQLAKSQTCLFIFK